MKDSKFYYSIVVRLFFILFIGTSLLISTNKSIWRDEAFSFLVAKQNLSNILTTSAKDFSPPLFYVLLHPLTILFKNNAVVLRLVSLLPILILQLLLLKEIKNIFSRKNPVAENLLLIILLTQPLLIYFSTELRAYSLAMLLAYLVFVSSRNWLQSHNDLILYVFSVTALLYAHNLGIFFWIAQLGAYVFSVLITKKWRSLKPIFIAIAIIIFLYSAWIPSLVSQMSARSIESWLSFDLFESLKTLYNTVVFNELTLKLPNTYTYFSRFSLLISLFGFISAIFHHARKISKDEVYVPLIVIFCFGLMYFYSWVSQPILYGRYVSFLFPFVFIGFIWGWKAIATWWPKLAILLIVLFGLLQLSIVGDLLHGVGKTDYKAISTFPELPIFTESELDIMPCIFYREQCIFIGDKNKTPIYIGLNQLSSIPTIARWSDISDPEILLIQRDNFSGLTSTESSYRSLQTIDLGDNVHISRLIKTDYSR